MKTAPEPAAEETQRLRRCLSDLAGIMALPARWSGGEPPHITGTLLDALVGMLEPAFAFARLNSSHGGAPSEMGRSAESSGGTLGPREIGIALDSALGDDARHWPAAARVLIGANHRLVATARLGLQGDIGVIVVGLERADFPNQSERVLLDVAANQAALGLQQARLLNEQTRMAAETEREARVLMDTIPGMVALLTAGGEIEVLNRQLLDYFGQTQDELRDWGVNGTIHPDDVAHVVEAFSSSVASGSQYDIVQRFRRADGVYRWFQNRGFPLRDHAGQIVRWCVLLTDIDERKRAEEALRERERESRQVVDSIPGLIVVLTGAGVVEAEKQPDQGIPGAGADRHGRLGEQRHRGTPETWLGCFPSSRPGSRQARRSAMRCASVTTMASIVGFNCVRIPCAIPPGRSRGGTCCSRISTSASTPKTRSRRASGISSSSSTRFRHWRGQRSPMAALISSISTIWTTSRSSTEPGQRMGLDGCRPPRRHERVGGRSGNASWPPTIAAKRKHACADTTASIGGFCFARIPCAMNRAPSSDCTARTPTSTTASAPRMRYARASSTCAR